MINTAEWIAIGLAVTGATVFLSYLVYVKATDLGHRAAAIWRGLVMVWLCLVATIVVLAGARSILGGPIIEYSSRQGSFRLGGDAPAGFYITAAALIVVGILLYVALRTVRQLQEPPAARKRPPHDDSAPPVSPKSEEGQ